MAACEPRGSQHPSQLIHQPQQAHDMNTALHGWRHNTALHLVAVCMPDKACLQLSSTGDPAAAPELYEIPDHEACSAGQSPAAHPLVHGGEVGGGFLLALRGGAVQGFAGHRQQLADSLHSNKTTFDGAVLK